jgi:hypothetical protein
MTRRAELPPGIATHGFAVRDAREAGMSQSRLNASDLERPFWGVRAAVGSTTELADRALAYFSRAGELAVVSHVSAAQLWGIPLPARVEQDLRLHISVPPDVRAPKSRGIAGHHISLHPQDVVTRMGVRMTTQTRTLCDLAAILAQEDLLAAADYLLWWRREYSDRSSRTEMKRAIDRHPTSRGIARLRAVALLATDRSDSPPESKIRYRIIEAGFPDPSVNLELYDDRGNFLAMPDLAYPLLKMAFDYEGDHHRTDAVQWEKDIHRVPRLQDAGWHHTRISKSDLRNSDDFLSRLSRNLAARGWSP